MLYTKAITNSLIEKYLNIKTKRNGAKANTKNQLINDSQFFLSLKTFNLEKNSLKI
jgi:hypothetical protein